MERRHIVAGTIAGATTAVAAPAIAQTMPDVRRRCIPSFPRPLDAIVGAGGHVCRRLAAKANLGAPWQHMRAFRARSLPWLRAAANTCGGFVHAMQASEARR